MKYLIYPLLLLISIFLASCGEKDFNDWDEYGFNGRVKSVETLQYVDLEKKGGEYIIDDDKLLIKRVYTFNEDGSINTWESWYYSEEYASMEEESALIKFEHKDGKKWISTSNGFGDEEVDTSFYTWKSNHEYESGYTTESGLIVENHTILSEDNGRDMSGESKVWSEGELIVHEEYTSELDGNRVVSTTITEHVENTSKKLSPVYLKEDDEGNPIEFYIYNETEDKMEAYFVRKFTYYE